MAGVRPALALTILMALPASAAAHPAPARVGVPEAVDAACTAAAHSGPGTATRSFTARRGGYLTARLDAAGGDWDLAVFRRRSGTLAAASAYRGAHEVASGFVRRGEPLTLRACRRSGDTASARVRIVIRRVPGALRHLTAVRVRAASVAARQRLDRLGFDVAGHGRADQTVLLHSGADRRRLRAAGFSYRRVRAGARATVRARAAALPSGRPAALGYRLLADYGNEMKALAAANPDLVRPITLPLTSHLGRPVEGLEITTDPNARDGKPVYLQLGMHHAREWPAAEFPLEFAYDLVSGYRAGDPRTRSLVSQVRTIVVPVVNPDGFNFSREAGQVAGHGGGHAGFDGSSAEYHRKNCTPSGCVVNAGVDLNRNYGDRWGGDGTSSNPSVESYRGTAPFSEPEAENIRRLISTRQVVTLITNHTFGNEILRQPGESDDGPTPDEALYGGLGASMAAETGYSNIFSYGIGDHVGTTDGWSYYTTGGLGYVIEMGPSWFHPLYGDAIAHYDGSGTPGDGNREAFYIAMQSTANAAHHAVLRGGAPAGAILRLTKSFTNRVTLGAPTSERFDTTMQVPGDGRFEWHVNQSSRPLVPGETWTLTCERPEGTPQLTQQVEVKRGETRELDLTACGPPPPPPDTRPRPSMALKLIARFDGRRYRVRVRGQLQGVAELWRCDGAVRVAITARTKQVGTRAAGLNERCAFSRSLTFRKRALPRGLRRRGARLRLRASATWNGSEFLAPASGSATAKVRRRR